MIITFYNTEFLSPACLSAAVCAAMHGLSQHFIYNYEMLLCFELILDAVRCMFSSRLQDTGMDYILEIRVTYITVAIEGQLTTGHSTH